LISSVEICGPSRSEASAAEDLIDAERQQWLGKPAKSKAGPTLGKG